MISNLSFALHVYRRTDKKIPLDITPIINHFSWSVGFSFIELTQKIDLCRLVFYTDTHKMCDTESSSLLTHCIVLKCSFVNVFNQLNQTWQVTLAPRVGARQIRAHLVFFEIGVSDICLGNPFSLMTGSLHEAETRSAKGWPLWNKTWGGCQEGNRRIMTMSEEEMADPGIFFPALLNARQRRPRLTNSFSPLAAGDAV